MLGNKTLIIIFIGLFIFAATLHMSDASGGNPFQKIIFKLNHIIYLLENDVIPQLGCEPIVGIPRTGQISSYAVSDDGDLQKGVVWPDPRFNDNLDGTVTDYLTNLSWTQNVNIYGETNWNDAVTLCSSCEVGGYTDWYLPNVKQLNSLIDYGGVQYQMLPTGHPFSGDMGPKYFYWTSTARSPGAPYAVSFENGRILDVSDSYHYKFWCVRDGN